MTSELATAGQRTVVVGIDGSLGARLAALRAAAVFGADTEYQLVAVAPAGGLGSERRALQRGLDRVQKLLAEQGIASSSTQRDGDPADELLAAANEFDATVVVGSRGAEMFMPGSDDAARIGSVALALLNRRSCDVLVVHNPDATPRPAL